jgi:hypothetical protein
MTKTLPNASCLGNRLKQRAFLHYQHSRRLILQAYHQMARGTSSNVAAAGRDSGARLGEPPRSSLLYPLVSLSEDYISRDHDMSHATKIAFVAAFVSALGNISSEASARGRLYPVTRCGPDLAYFCPIHGYFDMTPFHYNLAIYPGCIKVVPVQTPYGIKRHRALVCGAPERTMIWW